MRRKINFPKPSPHELPKSEQRTYSTRNLRMLLMLLAVIAGVMVISLLLLPVAAVFRRSESRGLARDNFSNHLAAVTREPSTHNLPYRHRVINEATHSATCNDDTLECLERLFNNTKVTVHHNDPIEEVENDVSVQQVFSSIGLGKRFMPVSAENRINSLRQELMYRLTRAPLFARKLARFFLTSYNPSWSIYEQTPEVAAIERGLVPPAAGRYVVANNTIRLNPKLSPSIVLLHEMLHAGATHISYGNTLWEQGEFKYSFNGDKINQLLSSAFPCGAHSAQPNFYYRWYLELDYFLLQAKQAQADIYSETYNADANEIFNLAKDYQPEFNVIINEKAFKDYRNLLNVNDEVILADLKPKHPLVINPMFSQYDLEISTPMANKQAYYENIFTKKPVRIVAINDLMIPGVMNIRIAPLTIDPQTKTSYLLKKLSFFRKYSDSHSAIGGQCQEAFGVSAELDGKTFANIFPNTLKQLDRDIAEYEQNQVLGIKS